MSEDMLWFHVILTAYGAWLPGDPRAGHRHRRGRQACSLSRETPWNMAYQWAGAAKRHVWFEMREAGQREKLWAKEPWARTIKDREDQLNVYWYIVRHKE